MIIIQKEIELKKQSAKKAAENAAQLSQQELELEKENSDGGHRGREEAVLTTANPEMP